MGSLWSSSIEVGHAKLDQQRKNLLYLAEVLLDLGNDLQSDPEVFSDTLFELAQRAEFHFYQEETFLAGQAYPRLAIQQEAHHRCREYLLSCFNDMARTVVDRKLVAEITHKLLTEHITEEDVLYRDLNDLDAR